MKVILRFGRFIRNSLNLFIAIYFVFQFNTQTLIAKTMHDYENAKIIEELRLKVPAEFKDTWRKAEKEVWEPWLAKKEGFLGRDIFYNEEKEEALLLVNWQSRKLWKNIAKKDVDSIQNIFEESIKTSLNKETSPFKLVYEGELYKQG